MNFNKSHVSRNLFPFDDKNFVVTAGNSNLTVKCENGNLYLQGNAGEIGSTQAVWKNNFAFELEAGTYYCNSPLPLGINFGRYIKKYDDNSNLIGSTTYTFTLTEKTKCYLSFYIYQKTIDSKIELMLNTGSEALPYEPYSSEVWHDIPHYIHKTDTDTLTTLPADIYPNDTTATVGLKGQTVQNGTPTPDNPIMPQGTGERTGNLMSFPDIAETTKNGVTYYVSGNSLYINGTSTTAFGINIRNAFTLKAGTYTNQMYGFAGRRIYYSFNNVSATMCTSDVNLFKTFTISEDTTYANALVWINNGVTFNNEKIDFALFESEEPKDYEPYGYKLDISSASTTTPVYLGEVESTRRIKKYEFNGTENIQLFSVSTGNLFRASLPVNRITGDLYGNGVCSHYKTVLKTAERVNGTISGARSTEASVDIVDDYYSTVEAFKAYLAAQYAAGTPVTVWYVLATEETAVVNEPLMKIGDYADEVSNISIPVTAGANTLSVDTTVQPSEVTVNYKGWHPVQSVHEKSRNLFDMSSDVVGYYIASSNGAWTQTGSTSRSVLIKCEPNTTYTISVPTNRTLRAVYFNNFPSASDVGYGLTDDTTENYVNKTLTITTGLSAQYLAFFCYNSSQEATMYDEAEYFSQIMLNEGSTALPYEPYWK